MIDYVALDTSKAADSGAWLTIITADFIAAPSCIYECYSTVRIMSQNIMLNVGGIQALLGYAVAIKNYAVPIFESEITLLLSGYVA
jgi:hypothetical protein